MIGSEKRLSEGKMSKIIFLNGCGSAGKTSIAKAIQLESSIPWLHVGVDTFIDMMPPAWIWSGERATEGFYSIPRHNEHGKAVEITCGPYGLKVLQALPATVGLLATRGLDVIVDEVVLSKEQWTPYEENLSGHSVVFVHVFCPLTIMQERERLRRDRAIGLSNDQIERLCHRVYDLEIDTAQNTPFEAARKILAHVCKG